MAIIVQSTAAPRSRTWSAIPARWPERVAARRAEGHQLVVVVSAMGDTTDELLGSGEEDLRGSAASGAGHAADVQGADQHGPPFHGVAPAGVPAISCTGSQSGIITDDNHSGARILEVRPVPDPGGSWDGTRWSSSPGSRACRGSGECPRWGGEGATPPRSPWRRRSGAEACEILSDVDGVYSGGPADCLPRRGSWSGSTTTRCGRWRAAGARVLNAQAVEFARASGHRDPRRGWAPRRGGDRDAGSAPSEFWCGRWRPTPRSRRV